MTTICGLKPKNKTDMNQERINPETVAMIRANAREATAEELRIYKRLYYMRLDGAEAMTDLEVALTAFCIVAIDEELTRREK